MSKECVVWCGMRMRADAIEVAMAYGWDFQPSMLARHGGRMVSIMGLTKGTDGIYLRCDGDGNRSIECCRGSESDGITPWFGAGEREEWIGFLITMCKSYGKKHLQSVNDCDNMVAR